MVGVLLAPQQAKYVPGRRRPKPVDVVLFDGDLSDAKVSAEDYAREAGRTALVNRQDCGMPASGFTGRCTPKGRYPSRWAHEGSSQPGNRDCARIEAPRGPGEGRREVRANPRSL